MKFAKKNDNFVTDPTTQKKKKKKEKKRKKRDGNQSYIRELIKR